MSLQDVASQFSFGKGSEHQILHEQICMVEVKTKWVPNQLTEDQMHPDINLPTEQTRQAHDVNTMSPQRR